MKSALWVPAVALLSMGCGRAVAPVAAPPGQALAARSNVAVSLPSRAAAAPPATPAPMRQPGDFVVYRFSGSYREAPVTLTQRVVAREHGYLVVDVTIAERGAQERLRLRIGDSGARKGELVSVAKLEGDVQVPFGVNAYGQLMNDIVLSADENTGLVDASTAVVDVGGNALYCDVTKYRVRVGAHDALMTTLSSEQFDWGHVGGEISTQEGKLLYKAEIVELGTSNGRHVAAQEGLEIYENDYEHFEE